MPLPPKKGDLGGECNREACSNKPAAFFNKSTLKYYCGVCAVLINRENPGQEHLLFGSDLSLYLARKGRDA